MVVCNIFYNKHKSLENDINRLREIESNSLVSLRMPKFGS